MVDWPLWLIILAFIGAGIAITVVGTKLTRLADRLADRTHLGEAVMGVLFLGASTSLPEIAVTLTAAVNDYPQLAISNAVGGIAAQTTIIGTADLFYRKANLEHAAPSVSNMLIGTLLMLLLALVLMGADLPAWTILGIHPITILLVGAYLWGLLLAFRLGKDPLWKPRKTRLTQTDHPEPAPETRESLLRMWVVFTLLAVLLGATGWFVAHTGIALVQRTGLSETLVGGFLIAVTTSMPEFITAIAAVRIGALTLAISDVLGGNTFDAVIAGLADVAYRGGSVYHTMGMESRFLTSLAILLTAILLFGMLRREARGPGNIGMESMLIFIAYLAGFLLLALL
ncbi:MAG: sodium:calcium antiporter [Armatimonadota bacterium]